MNYDIEGVIKVLSPTEKKSDKFQVREIVLEVMDGAYAQFPKLQFTQDRCDMLDAFKEGERVTISFNIKGREWNGKYFTSLEGWRIRKQDQEVVPLPDPDVVLENKEVFHGDADPFENYEKFSPEKAKEIQDDLPF